MSQIAPLPAPPTCFPLPSITLHLADNEWNYQHPEDSANASPLFSLGYDRDLTFYNPLALWAGMGKRTRKLIYDGCHRNVDILFLLTYNKIPGFLILHGGE